MLILVGLGLGNPKDITVNGLEAVQSADRVYLESYTSILCDSVDLKQLVSGIIVRILLTPDSTGRNTWSGSYCGRSRDG